MLSTPDSLPIEQSAVLSVSLMLHVISPEPAPSSETLMVRVSP